jgi:ectoine hydroxylase-related dioxygenase (phytanoyl-CoA dioxygenase family)
MSSRIESLVLDETVATYKRDGAVRIEGVFDATWLDLLAKGVERNVADPGPLHTVQQSSDEPGYFLTDFCLAQRLDEFRTFVSDSPAAELAARVMGAEHCSFFYDAIWVKGPSTPKRSRWHQDQPYYPVDGDQFCVIWLALEPVASDVCLELLRGSHRWGRWFEPELTRKGENLYETEKSPFERLPDIEANRGDYEIMSWDMKPGDCIVFHALTVHGAPGNRYPNQWRRAVSTFWMGDDAVFAERPGLVRPNFQGHGLQPGEPMDSAYFPRAWPPGESGGASQSARFTDPGFTISV